MLSEESVPTPRTTLTVLAALSLVPVKADRRPWSVAECWETLLCDTTALEAVAPIHSRGMPLRLSRDSPRRHGRPLQSHRPPPPPSLGGRQRSGH